MILADRDSLVRALAHIAEDLGAPAENLADEILRELPVVRTLDEAWRECEAVSASLIGEWLLMGLERNPGIELMAWALNAGGQELNAYSEDPIAALDALTAKLLETQPI